MLYEGEACWGPALSTSYARMKEGAYLEKTSIYFLLERVEKLHLQAQKAPLRLWKGTSQKP